MNNFPLEAERSFCILTTDQDYLVRTIEGACAQFGLCADSLNQLIEQVLPVTVGMFDSGRHFESLELPLVEFHSDTFSHINIYSLPTGVVIILQDASSSAEQFKIDLQAKTQDLSIDIPWSFVAELEMAVIENSACGKLTMLNPAPLWMNRIHSSFLVNLAELVPRLTKPTTFSSDDGNAFQVSWLNKDARQVLLVQNAGPVAEVDSVLHDERIQFLENLAFRDSLTELYNRAGFIASAESMMKQVHKHGRSLLMLIFDMDNLKTINDTYGHAAGDVALRGTAWVLEQVFRNSDAVARLGGDEFAVIAPCETHYERRKILTRIDNQLTIFNSNPNTNLPLSLSVGTAWYRPGYTRTLNDLIGVADAKMYRKKRAKKTTIYG